MAKQIAEFFAASDNVEEIEYETNTGAGTGKTDHDKRMDDLLDSLNNDPSAMVSVYRQSGTGKESMSFLDTFPPDKYSESELLMYLREKYGTGDYRIQVRVNGRLRANKLVSVEAPKKPEEKHESELTGLAKILETVMARQDQLFQAFQSKPQTNEDDFLKRMLLYKQLFDNGNQERVIPQTDPIEQLTKTLGLLESIGVEIGGKSDDDEGFSKLFDKLTPLIDYAVNPANQVKQQPQKVRPDQMRTLAQNVKLKMGLSFLLSAAKKKATPADYAEMVIEQVSDDDLDMLLNSGDYVTNLSQVLPDIANHREWFAALGEEIKKLIYDESGTN